MAVFVDTGVLYAYYDAADRWHPAAKELLQREAGELLIPAPVLPEIDYLLGSRFGSAAQAFLYRSLVEEEYLVLEVPSVLFPRIEELNTRYRDLRLGFVDAAVLALAEHIGLGRIATTDRRHFGAVKLEIPIELLP